MNNWLVENKLLSNIQQITINNEIYTVNHADQICYNEKVTKGTLLPLEIQFKQFFENGKKFQIAYDRLLSFKNENNLLSNFVQGKLWEKKISQFRTR